MVIKNLLEIDNLNIRFMLDQETVNAVRDVSITLSSGEVLGIVGESGAGKSTIGNAIINLLDDYLATDLFDKICTPIQLIWGEKDPWESLNEAKEWQEKFRNIKRLDIIKGAGHCPHDEEPEKTNKLMNEFIQETK